jgi:hypothetical protein
MLASIACRSNHVKESDVYNLDDVGLLKPLQPILQRTLSLLLDESESENAHPVPAQGDARPPHVFARAPRAIVPVLPFPLPPFDFAAHPPHVFVRPPHAVPLVLPFEL